MAAIMVKSSSCGDGRSVNHLDHLLKRQSYASPATRHLECASPALVYLRSLLLVLHHGTPLSAPL